jgi:hypothetical protein
VKNVKINIEAVLDCNEMDTDSHHKKEWSYRLIISKVCAGPEI